MDNIKFFLAGSIAKSKLNKNARNTWNQELEKQLKACLRFPLQVFNPISINSDISRCRFETDIKMLLQCDAVIVEASQGRGIGVGTEMTLAKANKIPIYTIVPKESHYRKRNNENEEYIHAFIVELSDKLFDDIESLAEYVNELYMFGRLKNHHKVDSEDVFNEFMSFDGGYDDGYYSSQLFWGDKPAELVKYSAQLLKKEKGDNEILCLDVGCGHGKNAIYLKRQGFQVEAIDSSYYALKEAKRYCPEIMWKIMDIRKLSVSHSKYDLVVSTGSLHCLKTEQEVKQVIRIMKASTKIGGYNVISSFNITSQDLSGHSGSFNPILLEHDEYLSMYADWDIIISFNSLQDDIHPNNNIKHSHSITRILARKK